MGQTRIETSRLLLREWREEDLEPFIAMNRDPRVMRYFPEPYSPERTRAFYGRIQREFAERGCGLYAAEEKSSGRFMGFIGFHGADFQAEFCPCVEIGWRLDTPFWNRGYATEGAKACLALGFGQLGFDQVYSFTAVQNLPSRRVMEKLGLAFYTSFDYPRIPDGHPLRPHVCYRITREQWRAKFGSYK